MEKIQECSTILTLIRFNLKNSEKILENFKINLRNFTRFRLFKEKFATVKYTVDCRVKSILYVH